MPTLENFRLRVFRSVAKHLNFSRAGEDLLLTQPAVTQQIKALESELDTALFDRAGGHIQLTPAGRTLATFAEQISALSEEAVRAVAAAAGQRSGELALGASQTIAQYILPSFIAEFRRSSPKVRITAISGNTDQMLEALVAGTIQLALIEGPERRGDVQVEPFMQDHMVLVVPASHEWVGREVTPAMIRSEPLLLREIGSGSRRVVENALVGAGLRIKDLNVSMAFDSTEGLLSAVEAGLGVTFASLDGAEAAYPGHTETGLREGAQSHTMVLTGARFWTCCQGQRGGVPQIATPTKPLASVIASSCIFPSGLSFPTCHAPACVEQNVDAALISKAYG